jgi:hypothetical protein
VIKNILAGLIIILFSPLLGVFLTGDSIGTYLAFPPKTKYVEHAQFSWIVFIFLSIVVIANIFFIYVYPAILKRKEAVQSNNTGKQLTITRNRFPWWGWAGIGLTVLAWSVAWARFDFLKGIQPFTFTPIWFGYIIMINALMFKRTGNCMMTQSTKRFLLLFVVSAVFWWSFEYLNRFVNNWYYVGGREFSALEYFIYATLPFSTVLPAVLGTAEYLRTFSWMDKYGSVPLRLNRGLSNNTAYIFITLSVIALIMLKPWKDYIFPMLWISPLLLITAVKIFSKEKTVFDDFLQGDRRFVVSLTLAAFVCGFFWEMWNFYSLVKWKYSVPFVDSFHVFEMPLLGYAGYLPFGLECYAAASLFGLEEDKKHRTQNEKTNHHRP